MICPNCGNRLSEPGICKKCGADSVIFKKTKNASIKLYNKGLEEAKNGELSQAVQSLEQCIAFDKTNISARNLLGLTYLEIGLVGEALKQWIISASVKKEKNPAKKYIDVLQNNGRELEKFNDSLVMYNKALKYLQQGNDDLALIQLKKAIEFNEKFVDAYNLLALCYINLDNKDGANELLKKVLNIDKSNVIAISYLEEIGGTKPNNIINKKTDTKPNFVRSKPYVVQQRNHRNVIGKTELASFFVGVVLTAAVLMTLIIPGLDEGKTEKISKLEGQLKEVQSRSAVVNDEDYNDLLDKYNKVEAENKALIAKVETSEKVAKINEASQLMNEKKYEGSAEIIMQIDSSDLSEENLARYNTVKETSYPKAAKSLYDSGRSDYVNNNYQEAEYQLEKCLMFASDEDFIDDAMYYLGKILENKGDITKAKSYYEKIVNQYSSSNQYKNAQNSLNQLSE